MMDFPRFSQTQPAGATAQNILSLRIEQIRPGNPRQSERADQNAIIRLAESVKKYGILQPINVRPTSDAQGYPFYEITDGHRRYHAATLAGLERIPCVVVRPDDAQCAKLGLISRIREEKLHFFDQAKIFQTLVQDYRMTQEEIARKANLSQSAVANKLRLLKFLPEEQERLCHAELSERHARALLRVHDPAARATLCSAIIARKATVSMTEELIEAYLSSQQPPEETLPPPPSRFAAFSPMPPNSDAVVVTGESAGREVQEGVHPHKFAMRDLRPLYNSIDRTLGIFRKTGAVAECLRQESEGEVRILIRIPKQA